MQRSKSAFGQSLIRAFIFALVFATFAAPQPARSMTSPVPITSCDIGVAAIVPTASGFGAVLHSSGGIRSASGTLWVDTNAGAFLVPFHEKAVVGPVDPHNGEVIAFSLPVHALPIGAFVDTLTQPIVARCAIEKPWVPGVNQRYGQGILTNLAASANGTAIDAVPVDEANDDCGRRAARPAILHAAAPSIPIAAAKLGISGAVSVIVDLGEDSSIMSTKVAISPDLQLNAASIDAARATTFQTEFEQCRPVAMVYVYRVIFPTYPR
jgi:hypothetical protein